MSEKHFETIAIRNQIKQTENREHTVPLYLTSSFTFDDAEQARALFSDEISGNIYTRFSNPNHNEFVQKMCLLEGTEDGIALASGMSAVFVCFASFLKSGDHIIASRSVFGSTHQLLTLVLPKWGITHTYVDIDKPEDWEKAITPNTKMIFAETPSNPSLDIIDLEWLGQLAKTRNLILAIDNCFCTPYIQQPTKYGADLIIHSATKYIDGQGRAIGGIILGKKELIKEVRFFSRHSGPALSPFNSWLFSKSLETLAIRMDKHSENASKLAHYLSQHSEIEQVKYPFLPDHPQYAIAKKQMKSGGGIVTFVIKGGKERAERFINAIEMLSHTANLGDTRSIVTHPASTTHSKLKPEEQERVGIYPGLIRISAGLEHMDDIIQDIEQAIKRSSQ